MGMVRLRPGASLSVTVTVTAPAPSVAFSVADEKFTVTSSSVIVIVAVGAVRPETCWAGGHGSAVVLQLAVAVNPMVSPASSSRLSWVGVILRLAAPLFWPAVIVTVGSGDWSPV